MNLTKRLEIKVSSADRTNFKKTAKHDQLSLSMWLRNLGRARVLASMGDRLVGDAPEVGEAARGKRVGR